MDALENAVGVLYPIHYSDCLMKKIKIKDIAISHSIFRQISINQTPMEDLVKNSFSAMPYTWLFKTY